MTDKPVFGYGGTWLPIEGTRGFGTPFEAWRGIRTGRCRFPRRGQTVRLLIGEGRRILAMSTRVCWFLVVVAMLAGFVGGTVAGRLSTLESAFAQNVEQLISQFSVEAFVVAIIPGAT